MPRDKDVDKARSLATIGTSPSFPAMVLPDIQKGEDIRIQKQTAYIQERADRLREEARALEALASDTAFLNTVDKGFEPIIGRTYWVYANSEGAFLSMIEPGEWTDRTRPTECHGSYTLSGDGTWVRRREEC